MKKNKHLITFFVLISFISGIVGSFAGVAIVSGSSALQQVLGISKSGTNFPVSQKVENITVKEESALISSVKKVSPAVVSVVFTQDVQVINPFSPYGGENVEQQGGGTGFIITSDGLIATNKHVANAKNAKYSVITAEGEKYDAKVVSLDPIYDFAILKIDATGLPTVEFGDSDKLDVGQRVIAIGNALGEFQNTVTFGVLSGKERSIQAMDSGGGSETIDGLLQTDAAINQGNSGGPLVNLDGQVIGINTATASKTQAEGLGFAIPINSIKSAIDSINEYGEIVRPFVGIRYMPVDKKIAAIKGMDEARGILVVGDSNNPAVVPGSPADSADIREGDVILKIDKNEINQSRSFIRILSDYKPGQEITLTVLRDGNKIEKRLTLGKTSSSD